MIGGEGTSPSRWTSRIWSAPAVARVSARTAFMIAELIGPADMNTSTAATAMAGM